jgi:hypothetical protein
VQPGVLTVEERRVRRQREQWRQQAAQVVADRDRAVAPADPDVDVQAPGVVALRDPLQLLAQPVVVLGVDDPLIQVVRPRVGAHGSQRDPEPLGLGEQTQASFALQLDRLGEALSAPGADLDLRVDQLAGDRIHEHLVGEAGVAQLLEPVDEREAVGIDKGELLLEPDREILGLLEDLPGTGEIEALIRLRCAPAHRLRRGRSRARRGGRRRGSRCAR